MTDKSWEETLVRIIKRKQALERNETEHHYHHLKQANGPLAPVPPQKVSSPTKKASRSPRKSRNKSVKPATLTPLALHKLNQESMRRGAQDTEVARLQERMKSSIQTLQKTSALHVAKENTGPPGERKHNFLYNEVASQTFNRDELEACKNIFGLIISRALNLSRQKLSRLRVRGKLHIDLFVLREALKKSGLHVLAPNTALLNRILTVISSFHRAKHHDSDDEEMTAHEEDDEEDSDLHAKTDVKGAERGVEEKAMTPPSTAQLAGGKPLQVNELGEAVAPKKKDHAPVITELAFTRCIGLLLYGQLKHKIRFCYQIFDLDGDGAVSSLDVFRVLQTLLCDELKDDLVRLYNALRIKIRKVRKMNRPHFVEQDIDDFVGILLENRKINAQKPDFLDKELETEHHENLFLGSSEPVERKKNVDAFDITSIDNDRTMLTISDFTNTFARLADDKLDPSLKLGQISSQQGFIAQRRRKSVTKEFAIRHRRGSLTQMEDLAAAAVEVTKMREAAEAKERKEKEKEKERKSRNLKAIAQAAVSAVRATARFQTAGVKKQEFAPQNAMIIARTNIVYRRLRELFELRSHKLRGQVDKVAQILLDNEDLINDKNLHVDRVDDAKGMTLLHMATYNRIPSLVKLLLNYNADPNKQNWKGNTPFHIAAENGHKSAGLDILQLLLDGNADPYIANARGQVPIHLTVQDTVRDFIVNWAPGLNDDAKFNLSHFEPALVRILRDTLYMQWLPDLKEQRLKNAERKNKQHSMSPVARRKTRTQTTLMLNGQTEQRSPASTGPNHSLPMQANANSVAQQQRHINARAKSTLRDINMKTMAQPMTERRTRATRVRMARKALAAAEANQPHSARTRGGRQRRSVLLPGMKLLELPPVTIEERLAVMRNSPTKFYMWDHEMGKNIQPPVPTPRRFDASGALQNVPYPSSQSSPVPTHSSAISPVQFGGYHSRNPSGVSSGEFYSGDLSKMSAVDIARAYI